MGNLVSVADFILLCIQTCLLSLISFYKKSCQVVTSGSMLSHRWPVNWTRRSGSNVCSPWKIFYDCDSRSSNSWFNCAATHLFNWNKEAAIPFLGKHVTSIVHCVWNVIQVNSHANLYS